MAMGRMTSYPTRDSNFAWDDPGADQNKDSMET
jgi:hypothetical protein